MSGWDSSTVGDPWSLVKEVSASGGDSAFSVAGVSGVSVAATADGPRATGESANSRSFLRYHSRMSPAGIGIKRGEGALHVPAVVVQRLDDRLAPRFEVEEWFEQRDDVLDWLTADRRQRRQQAIGLGRHSPWLALPLALRLERCSP